MIAIRRTLPNLYYNDMPNTIHVCTMGLFFKVVYVHRLYTPRPTMHSAMSFFKSACAHSIVGRLLLIKYAASRQSLLYLSVYSACLANSVHV